MSGAIWLASYPKSGNTWARIALLSLRLGGAAIDLADVNAFAPTSTGRQLYDSVLEIDSSDLTDAEVDLLRPTLHDLHFGGREPVLSKVHDAWYRTASGRPVFDRSHTHGAIYLLRDPRDVALSWARFSNRSIDWAIAYLALAGARLAPRRDGFGNHVPQFLGHWSAHVESWIDESAFDPLVVRYEDLHADPAGSLDAMARYLGWETSPVAIAGAIAASRFDRLADQERRLGFSELPDTAKRFFVSGRAGGWRDVLSAEQVGQIERDHARVMRRFGYL